MGIIHQGQALHRGDYGWLLCFIVLNMEEINKDAFFFNVFRCLMIFSLEKPIPLLLHFDILSLPDMPEPLVDASKECRT